MKQRLTVLLAMMSLMLAVWAQSYRQINDIPYTTKTDTYAAERLKLDIYFPESQTDCPVVVWFHGGGLEGGEKQIPEQLKNKGWVVVGVNYRFLPRVTVDKIIDDAAEAVAWVFNNIDDVFDRLGANLDKDGPGAMRKIPQKDLDELKRIYDITGATERLEHVRQAGMKKAEELGLTEEEYCQKIYTECIPKHFNH